MCDNHNPVSFDDLEDENEWGTGTEAVTTSINRHTMPIGDVAIPGFVEDCPKCRGTGNWRSGYMCFKCKGTGKLQFKTSPEARAKSRKSAQRSKARRADEMSKGFVEFLDGMPDVRDWMLSSVEQGNSWAQSMWQSGQRYGALTENMVAAIRKAIAKEDDAAGGASEWIKNHQAEHAWLVREAEAGNEFANSLLNGQWGLMKKGVLSDNQLAAIQRNLSNEVAVESGGSLDISGLKGYYAVPGGETRLKICVRRPGKNSRYHGWTFVDDGAQYGHRKTYGKQRPGSTYQGGIQAELAEVLKDPREAMIAYGKLTGTCGMCGRLLEDEDSIAAGIGPVCAAKA